MRITTKPISSPSFSRKRSNFHFDDRVQELGFAEALRDLALKYESKDRFIRTKLMIVVRMVDDH